MPTQSLLFDSIIFGFLAIDFGVIIVFLVQFFRVGKKILKPVPIAIFLFLMLSGGVVAYGSFIEPRRLAVTEYSISEVMPFLKNTDISIALVSDFHLGPYKGENWVRKVVSKLNELNPGLILIAGDFVFIGDINDIPKTMEEFAPLRELSPPLGIYAVLGNHDYNENTLDIPAVNGKNQAALVRNGLEKVGIRVLTNESIIIEKNGRALFRLGGLEELWTKRAGIQKTFSAATQDENFPKILLSHNPDAVLLDDICDVSLVFAGHTHAGQIRLPYWGSVPQIPDRLGKKYDQGYFPNIRDCKNEALSTLITRGLGESGPRARLFATPEIVWIH